MVLFMIESENGHDTKEVPTDEVKDEIQSHLKEGKIVVVEKDDNTTQMITNEEQLDEDDIDKEFSEAVNSSDEKLDAEKVKSAQVVEKLKGG